MRRGAGGALRNRHVLFFWIKLGFGGGCTITQHYIILLLHCTSVQHIILYLYTCDANTILQQTRHRRACINDNPFACVELYYIIYYNHNILLRQSVVVVTYPIEWRWWFDVHCANGFRPRPGTAASWRGLCR